MNIRVPVWTPLMKRSISWLLLCLLLSSGSSSPAVAGEDGQADWKPLFNGKDLTGWTYRRPEAKAVWVVCDDVMLDPSDPTRLLPVGEGGNPNAVLLCGQDGRGSDLMTVDHFTDYELHLEFTVPKGSNSGVYNRGLFEIQIFDSYGVDKLAAHDCGTLYERALPPVNASRPHGQWQSYDIKMQGKKLSLVWNGVEIYKDHDVRYGETDEAAFHRLNEESKSLPPKLRVKLEARDGSFVGYFGEGGTRSSLEGPDRPGPILLQGDHGPVAYRHLRIRELPKSAQ